MNQLTSLIHIISHDLLGRRKKLSREEYVAVLLNVLSKKYSTDEIAQILIVASATKSIKKKGFGK